MITVTPVSAMEKIFPTKAPVNIETSNTVFSNAKLHFQLAIYKDSKYWSILNAKVEGELADKVTLRIVDLIAGSYCPDEVDDYYLSTEAGVFPDLLKPIGKRSIHIQSKRWKSVWVTVDGLDDVKEGSYPLNFKLYDRNGTLEAETNYTVEVLSSKLPKTDIPVTNWMHYDAIYDKNGVDLFTDDFYKVFKNYLTAYKDAGNNMLLTPIFTPALDTDVGHERHTAQLIDIVKTKDGYVFGFDKLKKFIDFALDNGIEYFEIAHLFTQWGGRACPKIVADVDGQIVKIFGWDNKADSPEYVEFLDVLLPQLVDKLTEWGIASKCYFHLTDEPNVNDIERYAKCREIVKKNIGNLPIMDALSNYEFHKQGLVDVPVVCIPHFKEFQDNNVKDLFAYYCCNPTDNYYCNRLLNMPLQRARIIGFALYKTRATGFLHWGFNFYNTSFSLEKVDPYQDASVGESFPAGDAFIVYPYGDGVNYSNRGEEIGEGMYDYRLCLLCEKFIGRDATEKILFDYGVKSYNDYPRSIKQHNELRFALIDVVKKYSK